MEKGAIPDIEQYISDLLKKKGKNYLTVTQIRNGLPVSVLRHLRLSGKNARTGDMLKALQPHLENQFQVYKGPRSTYIGFAMPPEKIVLDKIRQHPGQSSKLLGKNLPMLKKDYIASLNKLLGAGTVSCFLNETHTATLRIAEKKEAQPDTPQEGITRQTFKAAYESIGRGRGFVRIHRIREHLGGSGDEFDRLLTELMADYTVELHGGDPSDLTAQQIAKSFTDENGTLYITLTWWGK